MWSARAPAMFLAASLVASLAACSEGDARSPARSRADPVTAVAVVPRTPAPPDRVETRKIAATPASPGVDETPEEDLHRDLAPGGSVWFAAHQSEDGRWSARDFVAHCGDTPCTGAVDGVDDAEATGLALLVFSSEGETHNSGEFQGNVKAGLRWLIEEQQSDSGRLPVDDGDERAHAIATFGLTEVYGLSGSRRFKEPVTRAVTALVASRRPDGGWPARTDGAAVDLETTVWATLALRSARIAELQGDDTEALIGDAELDAASGALRRFGVPADLDLRTCAMLVAARVLAGEHPRRVDDLRAGLDRLRRAGLDPNGELDPYTVYFGAHATFQGSDPVWLAWRPGLQALRQRCWSETEIVNGGECWSLPATGPSAEAGRLHTVALLSLAFRVISRYRRVFGGERDRTR